LTNYVPLLYISIFCFYLSSGIFNTSFVPALSVFSLSKSQAFGVILAGIGVQTVSFQYIGRFLENRSLAGVTTWALLLRAMGYIGIGIFALILAQPLFFVPALILYPVASGIAFAAYYTASNTMIFNSVRRENPGSALGVYSGIVGLATLVGSTIPVFASVYLGFDTTFITAGLVLVVAATITMKLKRDEHPSAVLKKDA
jgi:MFS family permease